MNSRRVRARPAARWFALTLVPDRTSWRANPGF
jgi:hypothetical protein